VVVLVTGMSGTGKTTVLDELARRGHRVVDTDDPGWLIEVQTSNGPEPFWEADRVKALLDGHRAGALFVAGCVANQGVFYDRFDAVILLSAPLNVLLTRVANRANPFGSTAQDRAKIASDLASFEPQLRAGAHFEVVTTEPVFAVADQLEEIAALRR
jgi:dephospho-CoA kinase